MLTAPTSPRRPSAIFETWLQGFVPIELQEHQPVTSRSDCIFFFKQTDHSTWINRYGSKLSIDVNYRYILSTFYWSVSETADAVSAFLPPAPPHSSLLQSLLFACSLTNFSSLSLSFFLLPSLILSFCQTYFAFVLSLFSLDFHQGLNPPSSPHLLRFSVVPLGGCSFVPPSSSPFWSGTGTSFLLTLSLPSCVPTFTGFQRQTFLFFLPLLSNIV